MPALVTAAELAKALGMPTATDPALTEVAAAADTWLVKFLTPGIDHSVHEYCRRGALQTAVNIWQASTSAGGQPVNADFTPAPYVLGASLLRQISGLIAPCRAVTGMVG